MADTFEEWMKQSGFPAGMVPGLAPEKASAWVHLLAEVLEKRKAGEPINLPPDLVQEARKILGGRAEVTEDELALVYTMARDATAKTVGAWTMGNREPMLLLALSSLAMSVGVLAVGELVELRRTVRNLEIQLKLKGGKS